MMSEQNDFPIDPQLDNWENCINAVKKYADIFVLIIGNRYGAVGETGKSITNTEYLTAVQKGIPIYTFSLKQMTRKIGNMLSALKKHGVIKLTEKKKWVLVELLVKV
jgi:hypothetical protein